MDALKKLRDRIDWLDAQIAGLLDERMRAADQVGKIKRTNQQEVVDQSREQCVLNLVEAHVQHPVLKGDIANIYREIMQESKIAQQFFRHLSQPFRRIGIIGMGLMGGSICKAFKTKDPSLEIGMLRYQSEDEALALEQGWLDRTYVTLADLTQNSDLIIIATPISTVTGFAEEIKLNSVHHEKLIVIDIASVKGKIVDCFEELTCENIEYIGTHPMAGKESRGFVNSQTTLFVNRPWIVVPHERNSPTVLASVRELILFLGALPIDLKANIHDRQTALISHIPSLLAKSYFDFVSAVDPESLRIAGPGFQSFTRLAHGNEEMREDIIANNQQPIVHYLKQWVEYVSP